MKALSLTQPWATLVAIGAKKIETRSWSTAYRGTLAIHAAKSFPRSARDMLALQEPFRSAFLAGGYRIGPLRNPNWIPLGCIVATCSLLGCYRIPDDERLFDLGPNRTPEFARLPPREPELSFGDYSPGRFAWILADVQRLDEPIPARGALGLWEWSDGGTSP